MKAKKIIAVIAIIGVIAAVIHLMMRKKESGGYILPNQAVITLKDVEAYYDSVDFEKENPREYFADGVINPYTLKYFEFLDDKFKDSKDLDDHLERAREYLYTVMSTEEADRLMAVYRVYMNYQLGLVEKMKQWGTPSTPEEAIALLRRVQEYRREVFGREAADALFGASVKAQEYPIRRGMIVQDKNIYGAEKEKRIAALNREMWGDEADAVDTYPTSYSRYQEKLEIYAKDLGEMRTEEERQAKIREIRRQIFTTDQVKRLEDVDNLLAQEKKKEEEYAERERRIRSDPNLDKDEKEKKIRELQDSMFGGEADAFRRRLAIERAEEEFNKR